MTAVRKIGRMKRTPRAMAIPAPAYEPAIRHTPIGRA